MLFLQSHWENYEVEMDGQTVYQRENRWSGTVHLVALPKGSALTIRFFGETEETVPQIRQCRICIGDRIGIYQCW